MSFITLLAGGGGSLPILPSALSNGVWWNQGGDNGSGDGSFDGTGGNALWFNKFNVVQFLLGYSSWTNFNKNGHTIPKMNNVGFPSCMRENSAIVPINSSFTFVASVNPTSNISGSPQIFSSPGSIGGGGFPYPLFTIYYNAALYARVIDASGANIILLNSGVPVLNQDIIFAVTMDAASKTLTLYFNGATFQLVNPLFVNPPAYNNSCYQAFGAGVNPCNGFAASSFAYLYELVIYSDVKTKTECNGLMQYIADRYAIAFTPS